MTIHLLFVDDDMTKPDKTNRFFTQFIDLKKYFELFLESSGMASTLFKLLTMDYLLLQQNLACIKKMPRTVSGPGLILANKRDDS